MCSVRTHAEKSAEALLNDSRSEFESLGEKLDPYRVDVELLAALMFDIGVQPVADLRVGTREYAGFLDVDAKLIVIEANQHLHRQRFSIAHEIGHYVLHVLKSDERTQIFACSDKDMEVSSIPKADQERIRHWRREVEANQFAAALLMPEVSLRAMHKVTGGSILRLAQHFMVSPQTVEIRLARLGLPFRSIMR